MDVKWDFSDVDKIIEDFKKNDVKGAMSKIGDEAIDYAKSHGSYRDRTGNLRASNKYEVSEEELRIHNDADYASHVESKGYEVLTGAALYAEQRLKEIFE